MQLLHGAGAQLLQAAGAQLEQVLQRVRHFLAQQGLASQLEQLLATSQLEQLVCGAQQLGAGLQQRVLTARQRTLRQQRPASAVSTVANSKAATATAPRIRLIMVDLLGNVLGWGKVIAEGWSRDPCPLHMFLKSAGAPELQMRQLAGTTLADYSGLAD